MQTAAGSARQQCNDASAPANSGICDATDSSGLQQRVCCDGCTPPTDSALGGSKSNVKIIVLSAVIPIVFAAVFLALCGFLCYRRKWNPTIEPIRRFPGGDSSAILH